MVKGLREQQRVSQAAFRQESGVTEAYISMIKSGVRKNPSLPVLKRLVRALGVPVGELLE